MACSATPARAWPIRLIASPAAFPTDNRFAQVQSAPAPSAAVGVPANLRSSGASRGSVRGSVGCTCGHETRNLASYDAGLAGSAVARDCLAGKADSHLRTGRAADWISHERWSVWPDFTVADSGPGLLRPPHPFSTSAAHATTAGAPLLNEQKILTSARSRPTTTPRDRRGTASGSGPRTAVTPWRRPPRVSTTRTPAPGDIRVASK